MQRPNGVGEGYSYTRLPAPARRAKRAMLRWLSVKVAASRALKPAGASGHQQELVVRKTKHTRMPTFTGSPAMRKQREGERCDTRRMRSIWACRPPSPMSARLHRRFRVCSQAYSCQNDLSRLSTVSDLRSPTRLQRAHLRCRSVRPGSPASEAIGKRQPSSVGRARLSPELGRYPAARARRIPKHLAAGTAGAALAIETDSTLLRDRRLRA